ncbi:MAG: helix-turn-helix domain-containing protein [Oscillospiraceae bacterium]|nr:helix-turn-helix domain-containing protein [Oscillospiraceae bacterium]
MNELIKKRRKELGITLEEIGEYVGVSKTTVQRWESGNISNMRRDRIKKLSEILQIDADMLLGINMQQNEFVKIPVIGKVDTGTPIAEQADIKGYEYVPKEWTENDTIFAFEIDGDSMEPRIVEGDIVIVHSQKDVENGETAVVMIEGEVTCKRVIKHSEGVVFMSNNPQYPPFYVTFEDAKKTGVRIFGKVIELRAKF